MGTFNTHIYVYVFTVHLLMQAYALYALFIVCTTLNVTPHVC